MLKPARTKFRKIQKGRINSKHETKSNKLHFGNYGLQALEKGRITARQIEALRRTLTSKMKRKGKVWIRIFPDFPVTKKPSEVRMGKGKGAVNHWVALIKPGRILYEISGNNPLLIKTALQAAIKKLGIAAQIVERSFYKL